MSSRKPIALTALLIIALYGIYILLPSDPEPSASGIHVPQSTSQSFRDYDSWNYNYTRDADDHSLTQDQCDIAFKDLYKEIDGAQQRFKGRKIGKADLEIQNDKCLLRVLIYDAEIFIIKGTTNKGCWVSNWHERTSSFLHMINRAIIGVPPGSIPNIEFVISLDDDPQRSIDNGSADPEHPVIVWGVTRKTDEAHVWVVPDYAYWAWPSAHVGSHAQLRRKFEEMEQHLQWDEKIPKAVWRGATQYNPELREGLLTVSEDQAWADVKLCDSANPDLKQNCITQEEHCRYMFPIHTEGVTYSKRLMYLQLCKSAVIVHPLTWIEHHHHLMQPGKNYIHVTSDWSNLGETVNYYIKHQDEALEIARKSHETFMQRYLTPAATTCYWRRLFDAWASVQSWDPKLYELDTKGRKQTRGVPYEAWVLDAEHPLPEL